MLCIGHRGAMGHAPENTLKSVAKALELGATWVEIDVHYVDGHLMVIHDSRLERTTNGSGRLSGRSFSDLRALDAGEGEKIPTLEEVLDLTAGRAGINIELKGSGTAAPVVRLIQDRLDRNWDPQKILVSCFRHRKIAEVKRLDSRIRTGALIAGPPLYCAAFAQKLGAYSVHQSIEHIRAELVADAHQRKLKVFVYTVDDLKELERMQTWGVDGVFTNYPDRVLNFLRNQAGRNGLSQTRQNESAV